MSEGHPEQASGDLREEGSGGGGGVSSDAGRGNI